MADSSPVAPIKVNAKRQKDDKEYHRHRLTDAAFNPSESAEAHFSLYVRPRANKTLPGRHPDPLEARPSPDPKFKTPDGVTEEMAQNWLSTIREARARTTS